jgi:2-polyprenyl-6-methoxyphenol hydroxylase-like FAD-dependent oxidoreductase
MTHYRILIVGAGLAGLSLARALRHVGLAPQMVEREAGWRTPGPACMCPPTVSVPCGPWAWKTG